MVKHIKLSMQMRMVLMSSAFITLKGDKALQKKINAAARRAPQKLDKLLARTAFDLQIVAIDSIRMPPKTGKIYKRRSVTHQASSPGQAPAFDTGTLARNIQSQRDGFLNHSVGSRQDAPHGAGGTSSRCWPASSSGCHTPPS